MKTAACVTNALAKVLCPAVKGKTFVSLNHIRIHAVTSKPAVRQFCGIVIDIHVLKKFVF
jgi:hypothetical protein